MNIAQPHSSALHSRSFAQAPQPDIDPSESWCPRRPSGANILTSAHGMTQDLAHDPASLTRTSTHIPVQLSLFSQLHFLSYQQRQILLHHIDIEVVELHLWLRLRSAGHLALLCHCTSLRISDTNCTSCSFEGDSCEVTLFATSLTSFPQPVSFFSSLLTSSFTRFSFLHPSFLTSTTLQVTSSFCPIYSFLRHRASFYCTAVSHVFLSFFVSILSSQRH